MSHRWLNSKAPSNKRPFAAMTCGEAGASEACGRLGVRSIAAIGRPAQSRMASSIRFRLGG
ncbi:MAG: hypothetical protein HQM08_26740 [Candidatus Riflebacteria bacterium]|nr:hypothetical protein [Candidatus Riflebacteria bacterium]